MAKETFTCLNCLETFEKGWSDEEALAEKDDLYSDTLLTDCAIVCDDCFNEIMDFTGREHDR